MESLKRTRTTKPHQSVASCFLLLIALSCSAFALDPTIHVSQYGHTAWKVQDGLFEGAPNAITQTSDGYLWLGTGSGLYRFDGVRFVSWTPPEGQHLPSRNIVTLLGARDGSLWIGMEGGLAHWVNGHLETYLKGLARVNGILEDSKGSIWIARSWEPDGEGGLCQILNSKVTCYGKEDRARGFAGIGPIIEDNDENLWVGSSTALFSWKSGALTSYPVLGLRKNDGLDGVDCMALSKDGTMWVGMAVEGPGMGLQQLVHGKWKPFDTPQLRGESLETTALLIDRNDNLWVGTVSRGIYRIHGSTVDHYQSTDGLSSDFVNQFFEDREGTVWAATSKGMDSFHDLRVVSFSTREGLSADSAEAVLARRDGEIWVGNDRNLDVIRGGRVTSIGAKQGLHRNQITSLLEDQAGRMWVGGDNELSIYQNGQFVTVKRPDGAPIGVVVGITEDSDKTIWVETIGPPRTLLHIRDTKVLDMLPEPQTPPARKVEADPSGGIWLGLRDGNMMRLKDGKRLLVNFNHAASPELNQLMVNPDGSVLAGTIIGLVGWKNGRQQMLTSRNGIPCNNFFALISDKQNALWLYTECGLIAIASAELERWWENPDATLQFKLFDSADGAQPGLAHFNGAAMGPDGKLWFASGTLLQTIDPANLHGNLTPPPVRIEAIAADRKNYLPEQGLRLPPLTRDLEIAYTALSFVVPRKVKFRYMLEGHETTWQEPGTRRQAFYNDLGAGSTGFV